MRASLLVVLLLSGCSAMNNDSQLGTPCDDTVRATTQLPPAMAAPGRSGVGEGDTWFIAPTRGTWSELVQWDGETYYLKLPIWTARDDPPSVTVRKVTDAQATGTVSFTPTSQGLPGPLPTGIRFPSPGCWEIAAVGTTGRAQIRLKVPAAPG
jgi:hypothetical protein